MVHKWSVFVKRWGHGSQGHVKVACMAMIGVGRAAIPLPLPPNRTGGFPASGSPVGGVTSERIDRADRARDGERAAKRPQGTMPWHPQGGRQHGESSDRRCKASSAGHEGSGWNSPWALTPVSSPAASCLVIHLPASLGSRPITGPSTLVWTL
jgi:hypothetical protein